LFAEFRELYKLYLQERIVVPKKGQWNSDLLQQVFDRLRDSKQTTDDLDNLMCWQHKYLTFTTDLTKIFGHARLTM